MPHPGVPRDWFRNRDGMGLWEGRGKVVATGVGTSPTARRWDEKPETSMGAMTIMAAALRRQDLHAWAAQQDIKLVRPEE